MECDTMREDYDLIVIGGGPGGYLAAITAAKEGLSVLLFEGGRIGGTCLNVGCIPTKYLLDKAAAMDKVRSLVDQKIFRECGLFSFRKMQEGRNEVVHKLVSGVEYLLEANKVRVVHAYAALAGPGEVECDGIRYRGKDILIATGSVPSFIPIEGAEYAMTSTQVLELEKVPGRLAVIGGGVIGMELASAYCSLGSEVTVLEVLPELFPAEDRKAVAYMARALKKRGIHIFCGTKVQKVEKSKTGLRVCYEGAQSGVAEADVVLMATGRKPNLNGIDTEAAGISLTPRGEIQVDAYMETSVPHIYAIGDAVGGYQLAHAAYAEGEAAVRNIMGRSEAVDLSIMPRCIYTMPAFAAVGISAVKAEEMGIAAVTGEFAYSANGMALAEGADGLVRVVMDKERETTLGVHIVGENAPEMIAFASAAVRDKMTLVEWERMVVAHPSLSEMIKEAALDCFGKSVHKAV